MKCVTWGVENIAKSSLGSWRYTKTKWIRVCLYRQSLSSTGCSIFQVDVDVVFVGGLPGFHADCSCVLPGYWDEAGVANWRVARLSILSHLPKGEPQFLSF